MIRRQLWEFANSLNDYAYVSGESIVDLPIGPVYVEITRGCEIKLIRTRVEMTPSTDELTFELDWVLRWRETGWVTADTHVHFLSPQTALLEGAAEGVNVVNLLTSRWGEMFSNVSDFDGRTTFGARDFAVDGEVLVRVGTENRMQVLGHISLLGYGGQMIHPLCSGGPSESALGDAQEVTMAQWAKRCIDQDGIVVMPHAPNPQSERASDIVLGVVHAIEMMTVNPTVSQLSPYGIADWHRYLNLGFLIPVCGGSDKMTAASQLGGVRTYVHLGDRELTYDNWMDALKGGHSFVTVGPLAAITVDGRHPGQRVELPGGGGTVQVESVERSDRNGRGSGRWTSRRADLRGRSDECRRQLCGPRRVVALRVRGSYHPLERASNPDSAGEIATHTSAVQLTVGGRRPWGEADAGRVLAQIEGSITYVDTIAARPDAERFRALRATLEAAHNRIHRHGVFHHHNPVHAHDHPHEH